MLLEDGIDPGVDDNVPLKWAAVYERTEVVRMLLDEPHLNGDDVKLVILDHPFPIIIKKTIIHI